jgi:hypothetical protein
VPKSILLSKPFAPAQIVAAVAQLLNESPPSRTGWVSRPQVVALIAAVLQASLKMLHLHLDKPSSDSATKLYASGVWVNRRLT